MPEKAHTKATATTAATREPPTLPTFEQVLADKLAIRKARKLSRWLAWALLPAFLFVSYLAVRWVGYLFGWLVGAAESPVAQVVTPLVFTLLAAVGIGAAIRGRYSRGSAVLAALAVAAGVLLFCDYCERGLTDGIFSREQPYKPMNELLGDSWPKVDSAMAARLYEFRWEARRSGMSFREFEAFMSDVVRPILAAGGKDKREQIDRAIAAVSPALAAEKTNPY